jgi:hypothetical protein
MAAAAPATVAKSVLTADLRELTCSVAFTNVLPSGSVDAGSNAARIAAQPAAHKPNPAEFHALEHRSDGSG